MTIEWRERSIFVRARGSALRFSVRAARVGVCIGILSMLGSPPGFAQSSHSDAADRATVGVERATDVPPAIPESLLSGEVPAVPVAEAYRAGPLASRPPEPPIELPPMGEEAIALGVLAAILIGFRKSGLGRTADRTKREGSRAIAG